MLKTNKTFDLNTLGAGRPIAPASRDPVLLSEDASTQSTRIALEARREAAVNTAQALEAAFPPRPVFPAQQSETEDDL